VGERPCRDTISRRQRTALIFGHHCYKSWVGLNTVSAGAGI